MNESEIIDLLFLRSEDALDAVARQYSRLYRGIVRELLTDEGDVEECANDILLAVWNSIPPHRPNNLSAYVGKIARRVGIDRLRYNTRQKRDADYTSLLSELSASLPTDADGGDEDSAHIRDTLSRFVRSLDPETQVLFYRRYVCFESVKSLAERFALSENHISVKLYRARKKLKKILEREGIRI